MNDAAQCTAVACGGTGLSPDPLRVMHHEDWDASFEFELMRLLPRTWHLHVVNKRPGVLRRRQYTTSLQLMPDFRARLRNGRQGEWKVKVGYRKGLQVHTLEVG
jgi:hypothetical protein